MKNFGEVTTKMAYSERHLNAVKNEIENLKKSLSEKKISKEAMLQRLLNIEKHLKEIAKELYQIRETLGAFDKTLPDYNDLENKYKSLVGQIKIAKEEFEKIKKEDYNSPAINTEGTKEEPQATVPPVKKAVPPKPEEDTESFIGTKVISIAGIILMMLGAGYGAKYAIENNLISPTVWIIAVYILGTGLLLTALKLKSKYENFSAVVLSGAMAIYYFTTYFAFAQYELISREVAFSMMLIFTIFTVYSALRYDNQIIAHIGFVGAYAVPFMVRGNNDNVIALFSFMAIVNTGILAVAIKKYWQSLFYSAFFLTWIIFGSWFLSQLGLSRTIDLNTALIFASVFFVIFYVTILAYKLIHSKIFDGGDVILILLNSVLFYSIGITILADRSATEDYLGLFTFLNGGLHMLVNLLIKQFKGSDKNLHYLTFGLALAFVTIAIPVEFEGSWLALFWLAESAVLFWIGRTQKTRFYEIFSYPLLGVAFISLIYGWMDYYTAIKGFTLFLSVDFLISVLFIALLLFMLIVANKTKDNAFNEYSGVLTSTILIVSYFAVFLEISNYWNLQIDSNTSMDAYNSRALIGFRNIWLTNYTLLYLAVVSWANIKIYKNQTFAGVNLIINAMAICLFLTIGLYNLSFTKNFGDFGTQYLLRYSSIVILAFLLLTTSKYIAQPFVQLNLKTGFSIAMHIIFLWVLTSELFNWMHLTDTRSVYKLGLSLLWGTYGFGIVVYGIWKRVKHLRIMSFVIFGLTILKLFFYDIAHHSTISKTIVLMSLGAFLLIISFLYNKYIGAILKEEGKNGTEEE